MRITGADGERLPSIYLALSNEEASQMADALRNLVATTERGWHVHIYGHDAKEDVVVYREDDAALELEERRFANPSS